MTHPEAPEAAAAAAIDVTDLVRCALTGARLRVTGFYRVAIRDSHVAVLKPCDARDPRCTVVATCAVCGQFHRPWDLVPEGPIAWSDEVVRSERADWQRTVASDEDHWLSSTGYPELLVRFGPLSAHETMLLRRWQMTQLADPAAPAGQRTAGAPV